MASSEICRLADREIASWHGLPALHRAEIPACLGPIATTDLRGFRAGTYRVDRHERDSGARVDVYSWWGDDRVAILDVCLVPPLDASSVLGSLPKAERTQRHRPVDRELWEIPASSDSVVEELVWGSRGLSVVIVRGGPVDTAVRLRGFTPMAAAKWIDGFVRFVAIPEE
jgi:hypothetical protein